MTSSLRMSNRWLRDHLRVKVQRAEVNAGSGLYEVDADIDVDELEKGRPAAYRVVARTLFSEGSPGNVVDTSAWAELTLDPGNPVHFSCSSLRAADGHMLELAYPEEAGMP